MEVWQNSINLKIKKVENTMTPEQIVEKINEKFNDKLSTMATKTDVETLKNDVESLKGLTEKSEAIQTAIVDFESKLVALTEKTMKNEVKPTTIAGAIIKSFGEKLDTILDYASKGQNFNFEVKADTTINGNYTGNIALSTLEPGVNNIARPKIKLRDIVSKGTTASKFVTYIQQTLQSVATWINEAGEKVSGSPEYIEVSEEVKKIAGTIKISKEMLADLAFVSSEVNNDLMASVEQEMENALLNGVGGLSLNGLMSYAQPFSPGVSFIGLVPQANLADVLRIAIAQIESANFMANYVVLHPNDVASLALTKTTSGEYTYPMYYMDANGITRVANLIVISTNFMTEGDYLVGDFTKSNVRIREAMNVQVGFVNDDFQRNMVTILAEMRLVHYVKANDVNAFVKGTISTSIALIDLP